MKPFTLSLEAIKESELLLIFVQFWALVGLALLMVAGMIAVPITGLIAVELIISSHSVSTRDAAGFTEEKFSSISIGMGMDEAQDILGFPRSVSGQPGRLQEWHYTSPKEPIEGWGSWDARYLIVSNNVVLEIRKHRILNH